MKASGVDRAVRQDVADLLIRYATAIDQRDWRLLRSCFTDDCVADYGDIGRWSGGDEITEWMRTTHEPLGHSLHRITNQTVASSGDAVTARSYVDAIVLGPDNSAGPRPPATTTTWWSGPMTDGRSPVVGTRWSACR